MTAEPTTPLTPIVRPPELVPWFKHVRSRIGKRNCGPVTQLCCIAVEQLFNYYQVMTTARNRYLGVQGRGLIALPADIRRRMHLDEPGAQLEMTERTDGVVELRAALPVPAEQRWFWTQRWQEREREVDEHVSAGRVTVHESTDDFLGHLDALDSE